jgi:hypothetical protein
MDESLASMVTTTARLRGLAELAFVGPPVRHLDVLDVLRKLVDDAADAGIVLVTSN